MNHALHPLLEPFSGLLGTWSGRGHGTYPTIKPFEYAETTTFTHSGKPFLSYIQRTSDPVTGIPMHTEMGYWRVVGEGRIELVISQAFGAAEICEGSFTIGEPGLDKSAPTSAAPGRTNALAINAASTSFVPTSTAKEVTAVERDYLISGKELRYDLRMAAVGVPMTHHLSAVLTSHQ